MSIDFTFKQVCAFIKKDDPKLIEAVDKLSGLALICSSLFLNPQVAALLPTLAVKMDNGQNWAERVTLAQSDRILVPA
jgi:hypothetical protein